MEIEGRKVVDGTVVVSGSKNSALPIIAASLLSKEIVILRNVPHITDVYDMLSIIELFNVKYNFKNHILKIDASNIIYHDLDSKEVSKIRGSYYLLPVLLVLFKHVKMVECGGCRLGSRPIDYHLYAFERMGCSINEKKLYYDVSYLDLKNTNVLFRHKSVGATINTLILSMNTDYTVIINPSKEPEVLDLISFLRKMGRSIYCYKSMLISCKGKNQEVLDHTLIPDRIEAMTYMLIAALSGKLTILNVNVKHLKAEIKLLRKIGAGIVIKKNKIYVYKRYLKGIKIKAEEYPKFSTDCQPLICALLSYADSKSVIKDNIFKERFSIINELKMMGLIAKRIKNGVIIYPNKLVGKKVYAHDLRCGAGLVIAATMAYGNTHIENSEIINRGYENIRYKLASIGIIIK